MKIEVTECARKWFEEEVGMKAGSSVRFFGKYGGSSPIQTGFSLGIELSEPQAPLGKIELDGVIYFVEEVDEWYFRGHDLKVDFNEEANEPSYEYLK